MSADFRMVAARHQWAPGALEIAREQSTQPAAKRVYAMLVAEMALPLKKGPRKPVASTTRRRDHAQLVREAAARRRLEESRAIFDAYEGYE